MNLALKTLKIINSCTTPEHLRATNRWLELTQKHITGKQYFLLWNKFDEKCAELIFQPSGILKLLIKK